MNRRLRLPVIVAAMTIAGSATASAACLQANTDGQVAEGRVTALRYTDLVGRWHSTFVLTLAKPACMEGKEEEEQVANAPRIQIFSTDAAVQRQIGRLAGKMVTVTGSPFPEHTVHHRAPIVLDVKAIQSR